VLFHTLIVIQVKYKGRLGNNMFQYALGRYLAEELSYTLIADPISFFENTSERIYGRSYETPVELFENQLCDIPNILENPKDRKIILEGWFQQSRYYLPMMNRIHKWFAFNLDTPPELAEIEDSDLLIYIRLGDYFSNQHSLTSEFYEKIIEIAAPRKIFIITDRPNHPFIGTFQKFNPCFLAWSREDKVMLDLFSAQKFSKIAISCSTFSWWAALLSNASKIYFPIDEDGIWNMCHKEPSSLQQNIPSSIDLRIDDSKFIYFYNCPTIKTNRLSSRMVGLSTVRPDLKPFHKSSEAFWFT
jgi:hypothetical protein